MELIRTKHIVISFDTVAPLIFGIEMVRCVNEDFKFDHWGIRIGILGLEMIFDPGNYEGEEE